MKKAVTWVVEEQTAKAVQACAYQGWSGASSKFVWIPKSVCEISHEEYNDGTSADYVRAVEFWFLKNKGLLKYAD